MTNPPGSEFPGTLNVAFRRVPGNGSKPVANTEEGFLRSFPMKTTDLVVGLFQLAGAMGCLFIPYGALVPEGNFRVALALILFAVFAVNALAATWRIMDALFGDEGLLCDISRRWDRNAVLKDRADHPRERICRTTHPSPRLQRRGAVSRFRNTRGRFTR